MGFLDAYRAELNGRKAYAAHVQGNRDSEEGKRESALKNHEKALDLYAKCIAGGNNKVAFVMAYGVLLMRFRRFEEAREMFLKAERNKAITKGERSQLRINYAVCLWKMGDLDRAIALMKEAGSAGMTGTIYSTLGLFLLQKAERTGDYTEAADFCAKALDYDDEDADALDNMGALHMGLSAVAAQASSSRSMALSGRKRSVI